MNWSLQWMEGRFRKRRVCPFFFFWVFWKMKWSSDVPRVEVPYLGDNNDDPSWEPILRPWVSRRSNFFGMQKSSKYRHRRHVELQGRQLGSWKLRGLKVENWRFPKSYMKDLNSWRFPKYRISQSYTLKLKIPQISSIFEGQLKFPNRALQHSRRMMAEPSHFFRQS